MKYYLVLNLKRQSGGPIATPEKGLKAMQESKALEGTFKIIGECDALGNLLAGIAQNNFSPKEKKTTKQIAIPKPNKAEAIFASASTSENVMDIDDVTFDSGTNKITPNTNNDGRSRKTEKTGRTKNGEAGKIKA
jgi:hypothetical protein